MFHEVELELFITLGGLSSRMGHAQWQQACADHGSHFSGEVQLCTVTSDQLYGPMRDAALTCQVNQDRTLVIYPVDNQS